MTEPLTPHDCDLTDFPFMPLDVARLRDSELASNETPEACWAAVLLWAASWHQVPAASVPDDDKWLAKAAGYGRVVREWLRIREGAMRGFIGCNDGRLYHPVVAEKAIEAWKAKLAARWRSECARVKKHNQRHGTKLETPDYETWLATGRPTGHPLFVPGDKPAGPDDKTGDSATKGQGEGQGQGDSDSSVPIGTAGAGAPPPVDNSAAEAEARRVLWRTAGDWLVANGLTTGDAKAFMNTLAKDFPAVVADALREAIKTAAPVDAKALAQGIARRLTGERRAPVTVPSDAAEKTQALLASQAAVHPTLPSPELRARQAALKASLGTSVNTAEKAEGADA